MSHSISATKTTLLSFVAITPSLKQSHLTTERTIKVNLCNRVFFHNLIFLLLKRELVILSRFFGTVFRYAQSGGHTHFDIIRAINVIYFTLFHMNFVIYIDFSLITCYTRSI